MASLSGALTADPLPRHRVWRARHHIIEAGNSNFTASTLAQLCDGLGVPASQLFAPAAPVARRRRGRPGKAIGESVGVGVGRESRAKK